MEFKDIIKKLRNEKGLNTTQLAGLFEKTEAAIRAWESGRSKPDADTLIRLAEYFECSTDYLLGLSDFKTVTEQTEHKKVLTGSLEKLNDTFMLLDSRSQENLANALIYAISSLSGHLDKVHSIETLLNSLGKLYQVTIKFTKEKDERTFYRFWGDYNSFDGNMTDTVWHVADEIISEMFENLTDDDECLRVAEVLSEYFPLTDCKKYDEAMERLEQIRAERDIIDG